MDQEKLYSVLRDIYNKYGLKGGTIDDVAYGMNIAKSTVYSQIGNKTKLILTYINLSIKKTIPLIKAQNQTNTNAIDSMMKGFKHISLLMDMMGERAYKDLLKYYPAILLNLLQVHKDFLQDNIKKNISQGIKEKYYRQDFDAEVISRIYSHVIEKAFVFQVEYGKTDKDISQVLFLSFVYHLRGIASPKGLRYIDSKILKRNDKNSYR